MNEIERMITVSDVRFDVSNGQKLPVEAQVDIATRLFIRNVPDRTFYSKSIIIEGKLYLKPFDTGVNIYGKYYKKDQPGLTVERSIYNYIKSIPNIIVVKNKNKVKVNITYVRDDHIIYEYETHIIDQAKKLSYAKGVNKHLENFNPDTLRKLQEVQAKIGIKDIDPIEGFITVSHPNSQSVTNCLLKYWGKSHAVGGANWEDPVVVDQFNKFMFNLIYNIYLLNIKFDIIHNDCHFDNMLVQDLGEDPSKWRPINYILNEHFFTIKQRFIVRIYDFDYSTKISENVDLDTPNLIDLLHNDFLDIKKEDQRWKNISECEYTGRCNYDTTRNNNTEIDSNIIIAHISRLIKAVPRRLDSNLLDRLIEIREVLLENNAGLIHAYDISSVGTQPDMHWSGFCDYDPSIQKFIPSRPDKTITCKNTERPQIDIRFILSRYINRYPIKDDSGVELRSFYNVAHYGGNMKQKYLKYKQKYLNLKKNI